MRFIFVSTLIVLTCFEVGRANAADLDDFVVPTKGELPTVEAGIGDAYGIVKYNIALTSKLDGTKSFSSFLRDAVGKIASKNEGNYVVTLTVKNKNAEVAKRAVFSFTFKNSTFLGLKTSSEISSNISYDGTLVDHFPVTSANNKLSVSLQLEKTNKFSLDPETYNNFSAQASLLSFSALVPAATVASNLKEPLTLMQAVLDNSTAYTLSSDTIMSFIKPGSDGNPKKITYVLKGPGFKNSWLAITISFGTDSSILGDFDTSTGKFKNILLTNVRHLATVGTTGGGLDFEDALDANKNEKLIDHLRLLREDKFPEGFSPKTVCLEIWDATQQFFSNRDAPLLYAAYLDRYEDILNQNGAKKGCVDQYLENFLNLGIVTTGISLDK